MGPSGGVRCNDNLLGLDLGMSFGDEEAGGDFGGDLPGLGEGMLDDVVDDGQETGEWVFLVFYTLDRRCQGLKQKYLLKEEASS